MESVFGDELVSYSLSQRFLRILLLRLREIVRSGYAVPQVASPLIYVTPTRSASHCIYSPDFDSRALPAPTPFDLPEDSKIRDSISWEHYYQICVACLAHQRQIPISEDAIGDDHLVSGARAI